MPLTSSRIESQVTGRASALMNSYRPLTQITPSTGTLPVTAIVAQRNPQRDPLVHQWRSEMPHELASARYSAVHSTWDGAMGLPCGLWPDGHEMSRLHRDTTYGFLSPQRSFLLRRLGFSSAAFLRLWSSPHTCDILKSA